MPTLTQPLEEKVSKVNDELAVGFDLEFQEKWWRFERILWLFFAFVVLAALAGAFGRGYLSKAKAEAPDKSFTVEYERIARYSTPSVLTVQFPAAAIRDGQVQLWLSDAMVKSMGAQRVIPRPITASLTKGGVLIAFPATSAPASVQFALEPTKPGLHHLAMSTPGGQQLQLKIAVLP